MSDVTNRPAWVDEILLETRRAGRAAVGARTVIEARSDREHATVEAMLPVRDALDRMVSRAGEGPSGLLSRFRSRWMTEELDALRLALRVLDAQLDGALEQCGVALDREIGVAVDASRHRVIDTRAPHGGEVSGMVVQVLRAGARLGDTCIREADVVATR